MAVQRSTREDEELRRRVGSAISEGLPPGSRAERLEAQLNQPVTGPRGVIQPAAAGIPNPPQTDGILSGLAGGAEVVAGGAALPFAVGIDAVRGGAARLAGGDPNTLPGGASRYTDAAASTLSQGLDRVGAASESVKAGVRQTLGVQPQVQTGQAPAVAVPPPLPSIATPVQVPNSQGEEAARAPVVQQSMLTVNGRQPTSIGDGIGSFSQMQPGDSQLALGRFERANQERERMIQISRRGQIGEGGGRLTVVRDSSRTPTLQERQLARLEQRQAETEAVRSQAQQGILSGMDERLTNQLNRQRTQQELDIGGIQLAERQRLEGLTAQMADTSLSQDQREAARSAYASLSTPAKDRYILQDTVIASDPLTGPKYGKVAIDVLTGRPVAGGSSAPSRTSVTRAEVEQTAKDEGMTVEQVSKMLRDRGITVE